MTLITTQRIPRQVPKHARARLMKLQSIKVRNAIDNTLFAWEPQTMEYVRPYTANKLELCSLDAEFAKAMSVTETKWRINCYILSRESNGKHKLTHEEFIVNTPCKHNEVAKAVANYHWEMIEEFKASMQGGDFITAGWIATSSKTVAYEDAYRIFEECGAWALLSDKEEEKQNE